MSLKTSIIIPYYNCEKYIELAFKNFSQFDEIRYELIFVNDGSLDNSMKKLKEKFPKAIHLEQVNQGAGIARNLGLEHANGDLIAFCDIDDYMFEDTLRKIVEQFRSNDIVIGQAFRTFIRNDEKYYEKLWKPTIFEKVNYHPSTYFEVYSDTIMMNKVFRAEFIKESNIKFPPGKYEDKKFLFDLYELDPQISTFNERLYNWNVFENSNSQTNVKDYDDIKQRFEVCIYQINNSNGKLREYLVNNTISHDIILYSKNYKLLKTKEREYLFHWLLKLKEYGVNNEMLTLKANEIIECGTFSKFDKRMKKIGKKKITVRLNEFRRKI